MPNPARIADAATPNTAASFPVPVCGNSWRTTFSWGTGVAGTSGLTGCSGLAGVAGWFGVVTFLKICFTFPSLSTTVLTNSYPGIVPGSFNPGSDGFNGFPFSSTHVVDFSTTGVGVGVGAGVLTFSYTCSISPFGSFLVSTKR